MAAQGLQVATVDCPNPIYSSKSDISQVPTSLSYSALLSGQMQTLSTTGSGSGDQNINGLLYVPDMNPTDPCFNASEPYVPSNAVRQVNLPNNIGLIAIAPWISPQCTLDYLASASTDPLRGFVFFLPGNSTNTPPAPNDPTWDLGDGGQWTSQNHFPVYAIPGALGLSLLQEMAIYSVNVSQVPNGHEITQLGVDPRDYIRLYAQVDIIGGATLPSLWVFLLIVLGILLAVIGLTSFTMHWLQRRRRQSLMRRVANGEVDLEALGIKRLTVPQEILDKMPLYTYGTGAPVASNDGKDISTATEVALDEEVGASAASPSRTSRPSPALLRTSSYHPNPLSQPTCAICLDDFATSSANEPGTTVRELPCHHIFHPECVDTFLRDSSSLCPMCKKTALPKGYCPRVITNAMVRRERVVRRIRARIASDPASVHGDSENFGNSGEYRGLRLGPRLRSFSGLSRMRTDRQSGSPANSQRPQTESIVMSSQPVSSPAAPSNSNRTGAPPASGESRREWARQRAVSMLGRRAPADPDAEEERATPAWRKAMGGIFPALR